MGISRLTLYTIAGNDDIIVTYAGPDLKTGKYAGWITHGVESHCRPIVNTDARYDTPEQAREAMRELVEIAKKFTDGDLKDPENPIKKLFESPEGEVIRKIISASKRAP